ncbi:hypothetical protein C1O66_22350 [Paucibacter aquatile]|uniref:Filamentous haemagglutinin FhaB/tRNA nuclease CdiA-like TPS domain-containing protein n=2 Tax=Kinneretia aquatilis TaxID=2070761 RepID=A0A2N8KSJ9_9BURK|nr:hypothetical protein C1O66_22350 [Paucibacter aquatile]
MSLIPVVSTHDMKCPPSQGRHAPMLRPNCPPVACRALVRALSLALLGPASGVAWAALSAPLPSGGQVVAGQAQISQRGQVLTVQQSSAQLITDWRSFNIGAGHSVEFLQPSRNAVALNRVLGNEVSTIQGALKANGQVFLLNPNGVLFTPSAQVNVGALVASTLNLDNQDFLAGRYRFEGSNSQAIVNQGLIQAAQGGSVALIAARISNSGSIQSPGGQVLMGAGAKVTLDLGGPVKLKIDEAAIDALIEQGGAIRADGGLVYLTARAAGRLTQTVINHTGITEARALNEGPGGRIALEADSGMVIAGGTLDVSASAGAAGHVSATAPRVLLPQDSRIHASGGAGGGLVQVGGGWQGQDSRIHNAQEVLLLPGAKIDADGMSQGDGGTVVVWSDGFTSFAGSISAVGGALGGHGGQVEVSGKQGLGFSGKVDTSAIRGRAGLLLLDPNTLTITDGSSGQTGTPSDWANQSNFNSYSIPETVLEGLTGDVVLTAVTDIIINNLSDNVLNLSATNMSFFANDESGPSSSGGFTMRDINDKIVLNQGAGSTLTFQGGSVSSRNNASNSSASSTYTASSITVGNIETAGASVVFNTKRSSAADPIRAFGSITTNGGSVTVTPGTRFGLTNSAVVNVEFLGAVATGGGNMTSNMTGTVKINGGLNLGAGSATFGGTGTQINSLVQSTSNVTISSPVSFGAGSGISTSGTITFNSTASMLAGGSLTLSANDFAFNSAFTGNSAAITLQPFNPSANIDVGAAGSGGGMTITQATLGQLNGFSNITIGRSDGTGITTVVSDTTVGASTRLELINDRINVTGGKVANTSGEVRLTGNQINVTRPVEAPGKVSVQALSPGVSLSLSTSGAGTLDAPVLELGSTSGPDLVISSDINTTAASAILKSAGNVTASAGGLSSASLAVQAGGSVTLSDDSFAFTSLALQAGGTVLAKSSQPFDIGTVQGVSGIHAPGQALTLESTGTGTVTSGQPINAASVVLRGTAAGFDLSGATHSIGTLAANVGGALNLINTGPLSIDVLGGTNGVSANGPIHLSTLSGNLSINRPVLSTDTSVGAIVLNAGRSASAGSSSGGDLQIGAQGSIQTGSGGRATLYSGSISGSTGLTGLLGLGSGRFRYNSDEASAGFDGTAAALGTGLYALYREQPRLRVSFADQSSVYGETLATPTHQLSGAVNGDTGDLLSSGSATVVIGGGTSSASRPTVGAHDLQYSHGLSSGLGYGFEDDTTRNQELQVRARAVSLSGLSVSPRVYDGTLTATLTGSPSVTGLAGDVVTISGTPTASFADANAGTAKPVTLTGLTLSGSDAGNYTLSGSFTGSIDARPITISATSKSKVYGNIDPALTWSLSSGSLIGNDPLNVVLQRTAGENVGSYAISAAASGNSNYLITSINGALTIEQRPITVTADNKSKVYGNADPSLSYQISSGNLVGSDALSGALSRAAGENVGSYTIDASALSNSNYAITAQNGSLSISPRPLTVTADNKSKVYGNADPSLSYQISSGNLVGSDALSGALSRAAGENVGSYTIDASALSNSNYAITALPGQLAVTPRPITVQADNKQKTFGAPDPALSFSITEGNLVAGDSLAGSLSRVAGESVGAHAILAANLSNSNYAITRRDGELSISPALNANVIAGNQPALTFVISSSPTGSLPSGAASSSGLQLVDSGPAPTPSGSAAAPGAATPAATSATGETSSSSSSSSDGGNAPSSAALLGSGNTSVGGTRIFVRQGGIRLPDPGSSSNSTGNDGQREDKK